MLKRKYRLGEIDLKKAQKLNFPSLTLYVLRNDLVYNRYGFTVSKKVDKRATVRNKIKRRLRFCVEQMLGDIKGGYDMLFLVRSPLILLQTTICEQLKETLKKKGFLR